jgi:hypothetical protein
MEGRGLGEGGETRLRSLGENRAMPRFLLSVLRPTGWTPVDSDPAMGPDIDALNDEMIVAGVRLFVGGLQDPELAVTFPADEAVSSGAHFLNGLWVLDCPSMEDACDWGNRAAAACRARVEVRPFH